MALHYGDLTTARDSFRLAVTHLVDAFLENRTGNGDLFAVAHRVGVTLEEIEGCYWALDEEGQFLTNDCSISALHSRIGVSVAMFSESVCSICEAADFECDHIPWVEYGDELAYRKVTRILGLDHVAFTQNPDFTYSYIRNSTYPVAQVEKETGRKVEPNQRLLSQHCQECDGRFGPKEEDLDPHLWERLDISGSSASP